MDMRPDYEIAAEQFAILTAKVGLDVASTFVPHSQSRNAGKDQGLNWRCAVTVSGRPIAGLEAVEYWQGAGHAPSSKEAHKHIRAHLLAVECEKGKAAKYDDGRGAYATAQDIPTPAADDVLQSLFRDADAIDYPRFEDWAADTGFDPDSRSGEAVYRACLSIALALRAGVGERQFAKLRELAAQI